VTVDEAARHLGLTVDAVRKRVQRNQIPHEKDAAGRVRIILDEGETLQDTRPDAIGPADALADELRDRIRYLERQVEEEREARRRADTLLAQLMQRIPELEAPRETTGAPQTPAEASEGAEPRSATAGPQTATERPFTQEEPEERRSWWRRFFGFD
jgi:phage shock protein A